MTLLPNTLIFFVKKKRDAKASHIFSTKNIGIFHILTFLNFTNGIVSFVQPGPVV